MRIIFYEKLNNDNYKNIDKKKEIIALINKNEINMIIIILIKKIKEFLKTKCRFNFKINKISKVFIKIKREMLNESTFRIINNVRSFLIFEKQWKKNLNVNNIVIKSKGKFESQIIHLFAYKNAITMKLKCNSEIIYDNLIEINKCFKYNMKRINDAV